MFWFWNRQARAETARELERVAEIATLRAEVAALATEARTLRLEWAEASDKLYRHMKRGEQAARKVASSSQGILGSREDAEEHEIPVGTPLRGRRTNWGARGRRALRLTNAPRNGAAASGEDQE
jgi:hypothetical protein